MCKAQVNGFMVRQKTLILAARTQREQDRLLGMWAGFVSGLYLSRAISREEYDRMQEEIRTFAIEKEPDRLQPYQTQ